MRKFLVLVLLLPMVAIASVEQPLEDWSVDSEPDITIVKQKDNVFHVYQINGETVGIKVFPKHGEPYFLVEMFEDDQRIRNPVDQILVPRWILYSW